MTDHNEAMRLADELDHLDYDDSRRVAAFLREQAVARAMDTFGHNVMAGRAQLQMVRLESRLQSLTAERDQLRAEVERLRAEREHWHASFQHVSKVLSGIHALMYPEPFTLSDGRTLVFRPKDPGPHEMLQALSDRIRAIPDEVAAIDHARTTHKDEG